MKVSESYLSELPSWISKVLLDFEILEVHDSIYDIRKYTGDYNVRIFRCPDDPFIVLINDDESMDIVKLENNKVVVYKNCYVSSLSPGIPDDDSVILDVGSIIKWHV